MNKENKYVLPENLAKQLEEKGATIEIAECAEQNRQDCLWYGGKVAVIKYKDLTISLCAIGDVVAELFDGEESIACIKDEHNCGLFYNMMLYYLKDDKGLGEALDDGRLALQGGGNVWNVFVADKQGFEADNIDSELEAITLTEAIQETVNSLNDYYKCYLEMRAKRVANILAANLLLDTYYSTNKSAILIFRAMAGDMYAEVVEDKIKFYDSEGLYFSYVEITSYPSRDMLAELLCGIATAESVQKIVDILGCDCFVSEDIKEIAKKMSENSSVEFSVEEAMENEFVNIIGGTYILMKE